MAVKVKISEIIELDNQIIKMTADASRFKFWSQEASGINYECDLLRIEKRNKIVMLSQKQLTSYLVRR